MTITRAAKQLLRHVRYQFRRGTLPFRRRGFSGFSEEQLLERYIVEFLTADHCRTAVDIGAGDGRTGSNTLALFKNGWKGIAVEWDSRKMSKLARIYQHLPEVSHCRLRITPDNILPLLEAFAVERNFGVLNLDIDSYDYWILDPILSRYRPCIVITEINEKIPPPIKFKVKYDPNFRLREHFFGYSIKCLEELCTQRGYALIHLEYNSAFLAPVELAAGRSLSVEAAYRRGYLERADRREKFHRNKNMELLHSVCPEEGIQFIKQFFSQSAGKYELSVAAMPRDSDAQSETDYPPAGPNHGLQPNSR